jgi:4,5-epoxidase
MTDNGVSVGVVGAGPTGLTLACSLAHAGVPVSIFDVAPGPERESSRATTIHAGSLEALDKLGGIGEEIAGAARLARKSHLWAGRRRIATVHWDRMPTRYAAMPNIRQADIETILRQRLRGFGVEVHWDTAVTHPDEIDATYVVGCDGAHSAIREAIGAELEGVTFEETFLLADVRLSGAVDEASTNIWVSTAGVLGILPLPDGWFRLNGTLAADQAFDAEALRDTFRRRLDDAHRAIRIDEVGWAAEYRSHSRLTTSYRRGRVLLAGDAAHLNSPVGGQGMNVGIGDAIDLGARVAAVHRGSSDDVLDGYQASRRAVAEWVITTTARGTAMLTARRPLERFVRNQVLRVGHRLRPFQRMMSTESAFIAQAKPITHWVIDRA